MTSVSPAFNNPLAGYSIVFALDQKYLRPMLTLMESIVRHSDPQELYNFFILHEGISAFCQKAVILYAAELKAAVYFIDITEYGIKGSSFSLHFTKAMYFRFLIPSIFRNWERILYLDVDMLAFSNIRQIFDLIQKDQTIAAVRDCFISAVFPGHAEAILKSGKAENYFNSGVIVFNCQNISDKDVSDCLENIGKYTRFPDQDILNHVYEGRVHFLPYEFNFIPMKGKLEWFDTMNPTERVKRKNVLAPVFVHYAGSEKPWLESSKYFHDDRHYYEEYQRIKEITDKKLEKILLEAAFTEIPKMG